MRRYLFVPHQHLHVVSPRPHVLSHVRWLLARRPPFLSSHALLFRISVCFLAPADRVLPLRFVMTKDGFFCIATVVLILVAGVISIMILVLLLLFVIVPAHVVTVITMVVVVVLLGMAIMVTVFLIIIFFVIFGTLSQH